MKLLHQNAPPEALAFFRVWVLGIWLVLVVSDPMYLLSYLPDTIFDPTGPLLRLWPVSLFWGLLKSWPFLVGMKTLLLIALVLAVFRIGLKVVLPVLCVAATIYQGILRGFGHVNHAELALLYSLYFITLYEWLPRTTETEIKPYAALLVITTFFVLLGFSFIGIYRIVIGGAELFFSDTLRYWMVKNSFRGSAFWIWDLDHLFFEHLWLHKAFKAGFVVVTVAEVLAPFCLVSRPFRIVFLLVMIPFFVLNWVFMNVIFWEDFLLMILLFDFSRWFKSAGGAASRAALS